MKNINDVLWKLLGEWVEVDILPRDWKNFEELKEIKYFCCRTEGYLRYINNKWLIDNIPIDVSRIYKISYQRSTR